MSNPPTDKGNILIVDDQPANLKALTYMLDRYGYRVRPAITGQLALNTAQKSPPDLILLDIMMSDTEGFEVCRQLKADERTRDIPVIFISALSETSYKVKAFEVGGVDYITKPFEVQEVLVRIQTHLAMQTMQRQLKEKNTQLEQEITERTQAEDELRKLSRAVEQSASPIVITNSQGQIEFVNPAFTANTGYTPAEAISQNPRILKSDFHPAEFYKNLWDTINRGEVWEGEILNKHKNGMLFWEYTTISPIKNNSGQITHFVAIKENITQRKLSEEATRQLNRQLAERNRDLYAMHKIGRALTASLDPDQIYQIIFKEIAQSLLNVPLFTLASYDETQQLITCKMSIVDGQPANPELFPPMFLGDGPLSDTIRTGQPRIIDQHTIREHLAKVGRLPAGDDDRRPQSALYVPLISGDKVMGVFFAQDYTPNAFTKQTLTLLSTLANQIAVTLENARLFTQLSEERAMLAQRVAEQTASLSAANAELSMAVRIKDEFLANMSHELRTPLNAILGMAEILKEAIYGPINPDQQNSVRIIEESGRHLLELINDILDLSKIEAGKLTLFHENVAVSDLCQASLRFIHQAAEKKRITVTSAIDDSLVYLVADQRRLKQILVNLLSNAVKFTPPGGRVGLKFALSEQQDTAIFIVWDSGIGIAPQDMERLFKPFMQLDSSLSRQHEGTGLGLSLVYRLAEMHGGSISLESQPNQGSQFIISLPIRPMVQMDFMPPELSLAPAKPVIDNSLYPPLTGPRILLAEDNEENISLISQYLLSDGYQLTISRNGAEAIELAKQTIPRLILMDIQMPVVNGIEAIHQIKADERLAAIPIIALTALSTPGHREWCLEAGADAYIVKPVTPHNLTQHLNRFLGQ